MFTIINDLIKMYFKLKIDGLQPIEGHQEHVQSKPKQCSCTPNTKIMITESVVNYK